MAKGEQIETQVRSTQELLQASREEAAQDMDSAARADAILTAVQDYDHGGQSLLVEAAAAGAAKEEKDDKAAAWQWSDALPLLAILGGAAAIGSIKPGSSGGSGATGGTPAAGASGVVFDTPVTNAIVFRDANGNGMWDAGEAITKTDALGRFSSLGGTGTIVATSLDRLVGKAANGDITYFTSADTITLSNGGAATGVAIDVGANGVLGGGDDFVWSGTYTAASTMTQGAVGVYVTAVSSLVTAYLASQGVTAPTQAQIDAAVTELKAAFAFDGDSGLAGQGANVQFFTSDLNGHVTKIMGEAIAKAQAAGTDVQQAIADALDTLAQAAADAYDSETTLDLTSAADLQSIYGITTVEAEALALQTGSAGPAVYSIWYTEDGNAQATQIDSVDTIQNDGPIGNITVLTQGEGSSADLTVEPTDGADALSLQHAHVLVQSAGDGSAANLTLSSATGTLTEVIVRADGDVGTVSGGGSSWRNYIQDGGSDQYDDGNYIGAWTKAEYDLAVSLDTVSADIYPTSVAYSGTVADDNFGTGSQNVAVYQDSIFGMLVKGNTSDTFTVTGETGSDGSGSEDTLTLAEYNGYQAIVIRTYGDDPSINRVFIYKADAGVSAATLDDDTDTEDFFISGLSAVDDFGYFVVYGDSTADPIAEADLETFFHAAVDNVMSAGSIEEMKTAFYDTDTQTALRGSMDLYAEFTSDEYSVDGAFTLQSGDVGVSADSTANADIDFSGDVQGNLSVVAAGASADASLSLHSTSGEVNMQGGDISVTASGASSDASATISNVSGNTGAVNVLASATLASASANISGDLAIDGNVNVTASAESADAHLTLADASSTDTFSGGDISVTASGSSSDAGATMINVSGSVGAVSVTTSGYSGDAHLNLDVKEDAQLEVASLTVTASNESATASADISGDVTITGDINVNATEQSADAAADINMTGAGATVLGVAATSQDAVVGSNITVLASGSDTEANAYIHNASGTAGAVNVTASGNSGDAYLDLVTEGAGVTAASLAVTASAESADAQADITGDVAITGSINVTASGLDASADVSINTIGSGATMLGVAATSEDAAIGSGISVTASAESANANAYIYNASGTADDISVSTSGIDAQSYLYLQTEGAGVTASSLAVTASAESADAQADINGDVAITGDITVTASGTDAVADAYINQYGPTGATVLGVAATSEDEAVGSNISVTANASGASAEAYVYNASGTAGALNVTASGNSSDAYLELITEGAGVSAASLTIAATGTDADASADIAGDVAITGDISVTATASGSCADVEINTSGSGATVLGVAATSEDAAIGSNITVVASGSETEANAYIHNASGTVGAIGVTSSADGGDASLTLLTGSGDLTIGSVTMLTTADGWTSADIHGNVTVDGDITITASGAGGQASADINNWTDDVGSTTLGGGDITILASGANAEASADIRNASGIVDEIRITSSGNGSNTDASLNLVTEGDGVTAASLTATATGTDADASADISGDVAITNTISVTATASGSCADVEINTSGSGATVLGVAATSEDAAIGSNVTVSADVAAATAALNIGNASGNIESLAVTANDGTASLDIAVADASTLTISTVDVTSNGTGHASADVHGGADSTVAITGNVTVSANGALDPATLYVNGTDVNGATVLGTSAATATNDISVTASTGATAYAYLNNASGQADELTVTAENGNADAGLDVGVASGDSLNVASLSVTASGSNDSADAYLWNHGASSELAITGSITVSAGGESAHAYGEVNGFDWERDTEGNWTSGDAVGHVVLGVAGTAEEIDFTYNAVNTVVGGHLITTITTTADVLPGTAAVGADLTVEASGASADASADIRNASGTVDEIRVEASGDASNAGLYLKTESYNGVDGVTAASLTVTASGDNVDSADANANVDIVGDVTITGAIGVTASGACADATADINTSGSGHTVLGVAAVPAQTIETTVLRDGHVMNSWTETVREGAAAIGNDLTVLASAESADASADIRNASGTVANINVTANANGASAGLYLQTESYNSVDGVTITGDISVTAYGASSDATLNINDSYAGNTVLGGGNLTVTASAQSADATVDIRNASGSLGDILVQATDTPDADALLNLEVAFGETLEIGSLTLSSEQLPTDASSDVSVDIRGNVLITGDISVTAGDEASLDINTWGSAETALGGGDITIEANHADADATVAIYNASGTVDDISVTGTNWDNDGEQYAEANLDLRIAEDQQLEINNISVEANGSADVRMDLNGNVSIDGDISIQANGSRDVLSATLGLNNAAADSSVQAGETRLNGGNISVDVDGNGNALGWIHNASGTVGDVTVKAFGESGNAALDLAALQPGQHQVQKITLNDNVLSALSEGDEVSININGYWFNHTMGQCAYLSNAEKLAEIVQSFRNDGDYAGLGADIYQEGNSVAIRWNDYQNHAAPRALEINGNETGFSTSENAAAPSLSFDASDLRVGALGAYSEAHLSVDGATGTLHSIDVVAVFEGNTASANVGFSGNLSGDIRVDAYGDGNNAALDLHADPSGRIHVGNYCSDTDMHVGAYGLDSYATASLSGLDGRIDQLEIVSDVKGAEASANLQFASGSLNYACMDAVDHQSTVRLTVDQTERNGTVDVAGQGHAAVTYYVDGNNATAGEIDLSGMHGNPRSNDTDSSSHDWWGYADIDLVAKYNDVLHQPGIGMQTSCNDTLWNNRMVVQDFNALRDSINVVLQDDADGDEGTQNRLVRHEIAYMHAGDDSVSDVNLQAAVDDLLYDARNWFDNVYSGDAGQGFYQREFTVNTSYGSYHQTYMVYDYQLGNASSLSGDASGLIDLGGATNISWRNVADRYDIVSQAQSNDVFGAWNNYVSHDLVGVHAIDNLAVGAYDDGANYQEYLVSHDADVMVSDITVEALNPGYHGWDDDTRAGLTLWSKTADGCGDSYFELRQSDVNVIAHGQWYGDAYASAELSLSDAWGTLNAITVEADDNADASAYLNYLSYHSDYDSLGSVKMHDMDVRALGESADAYLRTEYSDLTFDNSVVNVTAGYDAQGNYAYAAYATASLDLNWANNNGFVDGLITELNVRVNGNHNCADVEFNSYAGDIDNLRVTAYGWHSSADADIQFSNDSVINAIQDIYVDASGQRTDARAYIHATDGLKDIQITGGDITVAANSLDANAGLDMDEVRVTGQVNQIVVEAGDHADAWASISGNGLSVTHERDGYASNDWTDSSVRVSAVDHSSAILSMSGYGQYLDSVILSAGESSDATFSLDMQGFIDTLDIQVNGDNSYVSADIMQQTYGGVVNVSASPNNYPDELGPDVTYMSNVVDLAYRTTTAEAINIDNSSRHFNRGDYSLVDGLHFVAGAVDDTLQLNLLIDVLDENITYTNHAALMDYHSVTIDGWTDNDSISFNGEAGNVATNYEENPTDWDYLNTGAHPERGIARLFQEADAALDGTVDYYFGVVDGNGYLFHDEDGVGITTVVELLGVTAFDYQQIHGTSVI